MPDGVGREALEPYAAVNSDYLRFHSQLPEILIKTHFVRLVEAQNHTDLAPPFEQFPADAVERRGSKSASDKQGGSRACFRVKALPEAGEDLELLARNHRRHPGGTGPYILVDEGQAALSTVIY